MWLYDGSILANSWDEKLVKQFQLRPKREDSALVDGIRRIPEGHEYAGGMMIPRAVRGVVENWGIPPLAPVFAPAEFNPRRPLIPYRYQKDAVEAFLEARSGLICAPCGSGKTIMGLMAINQLQAKTLVLVHTIDLARQWRSRAEQFLDSSPTIVGGGDNEDWGNIVVATVQTLAKRPWMERLEWGRKFGLVILDEAHHCPAETFADVVSACPAEYRLGLTATPERPDGLTPLLHWHFGDTVATVTHQELAEAGHIMLPKARMVKTGWGPFTGFDSPFFNWAKMLTEMAEDVMRNEVILDLVRELVVDHQVLVISERVGHCTVLADALKDDGYRAAALTGKSKDRESVLAEATAGQLDVICATNIADEGLDIPSLGALVLAMPISRALGKLEQRMGRVMRPAPGKAPPVVVDLVDDAGPFMGLSARRRRLYESLGCECLYD